MKDIVKNPRPCNSEEEIKATLEINEKMRKIERELRSKHAQSVMKVLESFPMNR